MNKCRILVADDEPLAREAIKLQLQDKNDLQIFEAKDGKEALNCMTNYRPDVIFLDIQMPQLSGIEVLEQLPVNYSPHVIIVSAYDNYAIDAFEKNAIDYLVKPFTDARFAKAFGKAYGFWKNGTQAATHLEETLLIY